jgi:hypothetical protein
MKRLPLESVAQFNPWHGRHGWRDASGLGPRLSDGDLVNSK